MTENISFNNLPYLFIIKQFMYKLFTDKSEAFECDIKLEGCQFK